MELIADAGDDEIDEVLEAGHAMIEAGHGGQDHGAGLGGLAMLSNCVIESGVSRGTRTSGRRSLR